MLNITDVSASYGEAQVLRSISLRVEEGEIVTLTGRNGAGKTTLFRVIAGDIGAEAVEFDGSVFAGMESGETLMERGEGRAGFSQRSVRGEDAGRLQIGG